MAKSKALERRIVSYPRPNIYDIIKQLQEKEGITESKTIEKIAEEYFKNKGSIHSNPSK